MYLSTQEKLFSTMVNIIKREGTISVFDLQNEAGISVSEFSQISACFKYRYGKKFGWIEYNKKTKTFKWIKPNECLEENQSNHVVPNNISS